MKKVLITLAILVAAYVGGCIIFGKGNVDNTLKKGVMYTVAGITDLCDDDHDYEIRYDGVLWGTDHYVYIAQLDSVTGKETATSKYMRLDGNLLLSE